MVVYKVVQLGDPILRKTCEKIQRFDERLHRILDNMAETMYAWDGVGLAAPQIGISKRAVVIDVGEGLIEMINPEIIEQSGSQTGEEGCLSIAERCEIVTRSNYVKVKAQDRNGNPVEFEGEGFLARAMQHEIDHLDGILYIDKIS
jgi:peptide deformylase